MMACQRRAFSRDLPAHNTHTPSVSEFAPEKRFFHGKLRVWAKGVQAIRIVIHNAPTMGGPIPATRRAARFDLRESASTCNAQAPSSV